jgi:hypothetical protein
MTGVVESNIYGLWVSGQKDRDTAATLAVHKLIQVGGDFDVAREDGSENWSDGSRFGSQTDFINTLVGNGAPQIEAQSDSLAYMLYLFFGGETYTAKVPATSPPKFEFTPGSSGGYWSTWWKRVGLSTIVRQKFNKCKIGTIRIEGSTANKIVKVTPTVISLDPGEIFTVDPVITMGTQQPFVYTEGEGRFEIDGDVYNGHSQFAVVITDALTAIYGDSVTPYELFPGNANITLEGVTLHLDDVELGRFYTQIYGTDTPLAGAKPLKSVPSWGSYTIDLQKPDTAAVPDLAKRQSLKIEIPHVKWAPALDLAPKPDGGVIEHALAGSVRLVSPDPAIKVTVETGAGASAAHTLPA